MGIKNIQVYLPVKLNLNLEDDIENSLYKNKNDGIIAILRRTQLKGKLTKKYPKDAMLHYEDSNTQVVSLYLPSVLFKDLMLLVEERSIYPSFRALVIAFLHNNYAGGLSIDQFK